MRYELSRVRHHRAVRVRTLDFVSSEFWKKIVTDLLDNANKTSVLLVDDFTHKAFSSSLDLRAWIAHPKIVPKKRVQSEYTPEFSLGQAGNSTNCIYVFQIRSKGGISNAIEQNSISCFLAPRRQCTPQRYLLSLFGFASNLFCLARDDTTDN